MDLDEIIGPVLGDLKQRLSAALETHVKAQEQLFKSRSRDLDERERALLDREKHAQRAGDNYSAQPGSTSERGDKGTSGWQQSFAERSKLFTARRSESKSNIENPDTMPDGPKEPPARQASFRESVQSVREHGLRATVAGLFPEPGEGGARPRIGQRARSMGRLLYDPGFSAPQGRASPEEETDAPVQPTAHDRSKSPPKNSAPARTLPKSSDFEQRSSAPELFPTASLFSAADVDALRTPDGSRGETTPVRRNTERVSRSTEGGFGVDENARTRYSTPGQSRSVAGLASKRLFTDGDEEPSGFRTQRSSGGAVRTAPLFQEDGQDNPKPPRAAPLFPDDGPDHSKPSVAQERSLPPSQLKERFEKPSEPPTRPLTSRGGPTETSATFAAAKVREGSNARSVQAREKRTLADLLQKDAEKTRI
eukprot:CAMPEP_0194528786 /NCGR_PEP_ID=MMETSP0253-20130528/65270_1 /TAXON_ID=2966 /ORGANISM="Noctiluca scintillans" /LENGTH=422 /DNA_ID=CAMNT_0039373869 /DNA_START=1 /DNA_END=1269 /DNA_ORIENTATION=+